MPTHLILLCIIANLTTSIASPTIGNITSDTKVNMLRKFFSHSQFDIVFVQEVAVPSFNAFGYEEVVNLGPGRRGTAILYHENIPLNSFHRTP